MSTWEITTEYKKSSVERQFWYKDDKVIIREEGFRWATFTLESDSIPLTPEELRNEDGFELDGDWEMVDMVDGCWADIEAGRNCTDEDLEQFEAAYEESWSEGVEELGWSLDDCEYYMTGPLKLTNVDTGAEFSGLVDPTTVVHTIELPSEEVLPELAPIVDIKEGAKWPFTNPVASTKETAKWPFELETEMTEDGIALTDWFPAEIKPVRKGVYEVLTLESIDWPYPNKGLWDGKKWDFLDQTVTEWRGLAKDPEKV